MAACRLAWTPGLAGSTVVVRTPMRFQGLHPSDQNKAMRRRFADFACRQYGDREHPLLWCVHVQDVTRRGRFYPHQRPEGATQAIVRFFDALAG